MSYEQFAKVIWTAIYVLVALGIASLFSWGLLELILFIEKITRKSKRKSKELS